MTAPRPATPRSAAEPDEASKGPRCRQCGEIMREEWQYAQRAPERALCVDCAFDTFPCTD